MVYRKDIFKMRQHHKMLAIQFVIQITAIIGLIYYPFSWSLLLGLIVFPLICLCCYYHRYCSHNSFKTSIEIETVVHYLSILLMQGSAILWASNHITHHKHSDKEGDPHPASEGWKTWFWWDTYNNSKLNAFKVKKMLKNPLYKYTHNNYFKLYFIMMATLIFISPQFTVYFVLLPVMYTFHATSIVNVLTHKYGYRNFNTPDKSTNLPLPMFDCLHNNHHKYPNRYNTKIKWYEFDIPAFLIKNVLERP
jgi:stearoyl-CoA desaturase (delta-9 desaturase)